MQAAGNGVAGSPIALNKSIELSRELRAKL
jgi:hypothetical protein